MKRFVIRMEPKFIGIMLLIITVVIFTTLFSLTNELQKAGVTQCSCPTGGCPMETPLPIQLYIGFITALALAGVGIFMLIPKQIEKETREKEWKGVVKTLKGDEKMVYQTVLDSGGLILQGDIVEKTRLTKVKVSRILDKLEIKGLVERRRRGMINVVVLK